MAKKESKKSESKKKAAKGKATKKAKDSAKEPVKAKAETKGKTTDKAKSKQASAKKPAGKPVAKQKTPSEAPVKTRKSSLKSQGEASSGKNKEVPAGATLFSEFDIYLFKEGRHYRLYDKLGSHLMEHEGQKGVYFAVWAPNAEKVSVIGDFNGWNRLENKMHVRHDGSGIWELFIPNIAEGAIYKYFIRSHNEGYEVEKGDPFAFRWQTPPDTASMVWDNKNEWNDEAWMKERKEKAGKPQPYSVYELHAGSWKRVPEDGNRSLSYRELAEQLPGYIKELGFTHVEFMPVMEHPFFGSWGYQITGYFAPSNRYGTPQDFMHLVETLHKEGIGVILDWVPSHYPSDAHGLHYFDGTHLYEHSDPRKGYHPDWKSYIFNYGRGEVKSFLISNALYWLDKFHIDGLRVDAVASMLYLDYSREEGEWEPNEHGGRENLEAIDFLKTFNETVYDQFPDVQTIAEESTSYPMVSRPTYIGGLGFGMKWMMGWMHDTLDYFQKDPLYRQHHQNEITFSTYYAFTENFMLPLSHDEVVYGKGPLWDKMPGDEWQKFANLRALYGYMFAHPGTKLLFMGGEFGQSTEWKHDESLPWHLTEYPLHQGVQRALSRLNHLYKTEKSLYEISFEERGFEWVDFHDSANSVISFLRKGKESSDMMLIVCNFTPVPRQNYRIGVPVQSQWREVFNSDDESYGGSNVTNPDNMHSEPLQAHGRDHSVTLTLPPLGVTYLKFEGD